MSVAYVLILYLALVTSMVEHSSARRPHISAEELFQKSTSLQSGSEAAVLHGEGAPPSLLDGQSGTAGAVATSSCFFNRDCHAREFCVKPDSGVLTLGACSLLPDAALARRRGASEHVRDLHFLVRNRRSVPASSPRRGTNDLLRQLLGEESQLARALNSYLHAKYPNQWKKVSLGRHHKGQEGMVDRDSANTAEEGIDSVEDTADPDLLAILDRASIRMVEDATSTESPMVSGLSAKQSDSNDYGRSGTPGSQAEKDKQKDVVVDVKEGDMAIGPKRRPVTRSPNSLR